MARSLNVERILHQSPNRRDGRFGGNMPTSCLERINIQQQYQALSAKCFGNSRIHERRLTVAFAPGPCGRLGRDDPGPSRRRRSPSSAAASPSPETAARQSALAELEERRADGAGREQYVQQRIDGTVAERH